MVNYLEYILRVSVGRFSRFYCTFHSMSRTFAPLILPKSRQVQLHLSHIFSYKPHNDDSDFRGQVKYNHVCMVVTTITYALLDSGSTKQSHTLILKHNVIVVNYHAHMIILYLSSVRPIIIISSQLPFQRVSCLEVCTQRLLHCQP